FTNYTLKMENQTKFTIIVLKKAASPQTINILDRLLSGEKLKYFNSYDADTCASHNRPDIIMALLKVNIKCTSEGANWMARFGHLEVVRELMAHGICCTKYGADLAARNGHLHVIHDLRAHNIHCTSEGA